jgi:hypothetical protein
MFFQQLAKGAGSVLNPTIRMMDLGRHLPKLNRALKASITSSLSNESPSFQPTNRLVFKSNCPAK